MFVDDVNRNGDYRQPDHWDSGFFPPGTARLPATGMRHSDALEFSIWLTRRESGSWKYRVPSGTEAASIQGSADPAFRGLTLWATVTDGSAPPGRASAPAKLQLGEIRRRWTYDRQVIEASEEPALRLARAAMRLILLEAWTSLIWVDLAFDPARARDLAYLRFPLGHGRHLARERAQALARDLGFALGRGLCLPDTMEHSRGLVESPLLEFALGDGQRREIRGFSGALDTASEADLVDHRGQACALALELADVLNADGTRSAARARDLALRLASQAEPLLAWYCLLEERAEQRVPAVEGLWLVRTPVGAERPFAVRAATASR